MVAVLHIFWFQYKRSIQV